MYLNPVLDFIVDQTIELNFYLFKKEIWLILKIKLHLIGIAANNVELWQLAVLIEAGRNRNSVTTGKC